MNNYNRNMFGVTLLNNDECLVRVGLSGRFKIIYKNSDGGTYYKRKSSLNASIYFREVLGCMFDLKIIPFLLSDLIKAKPLDFLIMVENDKFQDVVEYFASAIMSNGGVRWNSFFAGSPYDVAKLFDE